MQLNGDRLREAREAAGFSRPQLYRATGVSIDTISRAEAGQNIPLATHLATLAAALGISMDSLFDDETAGVA
jgi:transcriptional regulator with XRE-family HTH domain